MIVLILRQPWATLVGKKQTKEEYMNFISSGELKYYESKHESIEDEKTEKISSLVEKIKTMALPFGSARYSGT